MPTRQVAVIVGSLRKESFNRKTALALASLAPAPLKLDIVPIDLPLFNEDLEASPPAPWLAFRQKVKESDAVLFVTPEYNRSFPGALKNALDVASRPYGKSVWNAKPAAVVSVSIGAHGGFGANHHLRQCLMYLNMPCMPGPEVYLGHASKLFDASGTLTSPETRDHLTKFITAYAAWVDKHAPH